MNQHTTIRQVIEAGAASSLPVYAHAFSRAPASPCLTGWSSCIFALEDNGSNLVRRVLEQESSIGENTVENVVLRTKWPDSEKDYKMRGKVYPRIDHFFPRNAKDGDVFVSRSGNIGTAKLSYLRPRILDLSLSASALAECYVLYHKTASDGTPQYFRLLSGPLFILTRISLAIALPERRIEIWKQLLVYLLSVNSLPTGEFRNSFHLVDHEKWVELVLSNSDSTIIGHSAHREMKNWLERPLEQSTAKSELAERPSEISKKSQNHLRTRRSAGRRCTTSLCSSAQTLRWSLGTSSKYSSRKRVQSASQIRSQLNDAPTGSLFPLDTSHKTVLLLLEQLSPQ